MKGALGVARRMLDPKTKEATAFYSALAAALWDVIQRGFHLWTVLFLASLCGVTVAGMLAILTGRAGVEAEKTESEQVEAETGK